VFAVEHPDISWDRLKEYNEASPPEAEAAVVGLSAWRARLETSIQEVWPLLAPLAKYMLINLEVCEKTGRMHGQAMIIMNNPCSALTVKKYLNAAFAGGSWSPNPHVEYMRKEPVANIKYCTKVPTRLRGTVSREFGGYTCFSFRDQWEYDIDHDWYSLINVLTLF